MKYKELESIESFDIYDGSWISIKEYVFMRLFNKHHIPLRKTLEDIPHLEYTNLVITFSIEKKKYVKNERIFETCLITNKDLKKMNVKLEELQEVANHNMENKNKTRIQTPVEFAQNTYMLAPIIDVPDYIGTSINIGNLTGTYNKSTEAPVFAPPHGADKSDNILFLSNRTKIFAAIGMTQRDTLDKVASIFKDNFYIAPISVHGVLCVKKEFATKQGRLTEQQAIEDLKDMLEDINETANDEGSSILTYDIYYYEKDDYTTMLCK